MLATSQIQYLLNDYLLVIIFIRDLFPQEYFQSGTLLKNKSNQSDLFIQLREGTFDAINDRFVERMLFSIYLDQHNPQSLQETYVFDLDYESQNVTVVSGRINEGKVIKDLIEMLQELDPLPCRKYFSFSLLFNEFCPYSYQPKGFEDTGNFASKIILDIDTLKKLQTLNVSIQVGVKSEGNEVDLLRKEFRFPDFAYGVVGLFGLTAELEDPQLIPDPLDLEIFLGNDQARNIPETQVFVDLTSDVEKVEVEMIERGVVLNSDTLGIAVIPLPLRKTMVTPPILHNEHVFSSELFLRLQLQRGPQISPFKDPNTLGCKTCKTQLNHASYGFYDIPSFPISCFLCTFTEFDIDFLLLTKIRQIVHFLISTKEFPTFSQIFSLFRVRENSLATQIFNKLFLDGLIYNSQRPSYKKGTVDFEQGCTELIPTINGIKDQRGVELVIGRAYYILFSPLSGISVGDISLEAMSIYFPNYSSVSFEKNFRANLKTFKRSLGLKALSLANNASLVSENLTQGSQASVTDSQTRDLGFEESLAYLLNTQVDLNSNHTVNELSRKFERVWDPRATKKVKY